MTAPVKQLLHSFEGLSEAEQAEAVSLILRRALERNLAPLSDNEMVASADELFAELDNREATDDQH